MATGCLGRPLPHYAPQEHPHAHHLWDIASTEFGYEVTYGGGPAGVYSGSGAAASGFVWDGAPGSAGPLTHHYPPHDAFAAAAAAAGLPLHDLWQNHPFRNQCVMAHRYGPAGVAGTNKKPRRRVPTVAQRRAANIRERRRMFNLNEAFDKLRRKVPTFAYEKRLSRIETLKLAITYISFMTELLASEGENTPPINSGRNISRGPANALTPIHTSDDTPSPIGPSNGRHHHHNHFGENGHKRGDPGSYQDSRSLVNN